MTTSSIKDPVSAIRKFLAALPVRSDSSEDGRQDSAGQVLCAMVDAGLDRLSLPGGGQTLQRWRALAAVAAHDLSLAKLYEAHTDALAILAEAGMESEQPLRVWGVWCAEPPQARLDIHHPAAEEAGAVVLDGVKAWCSGANTITHAVVSGWNRDGRPCLAAVDLDQSGITVTNEGWHAVGMAETASVDVLFDNVRGVAVGGADFYTGRPGFWHGGAGIAACWYGAAAQLALYLRQHLTDQSNPHALAQLGRADVALSACAASLRAAAQYIDTAPASDAYRLAMRVRLMAEDAANQVMHAFGRALGAAPLCRDPWAARMMADLPVFLRQSHADRDLEALAHSLLQRDGEAENGEEEWQL
jgi:hypothetical protein